MFAGFIQGGIYMFINTNIAAVNSQRHLYKTNLDLDKSLERLSSGMRINSAADDASGLAISEKMQAQIQGLTNAVQNTQDGAALFKIAEGALDQVGKMLSRLEELAVRAGNKTLTDSDRATMKDEVSQLIDQINSISNNTEYNTIKLLNGNLDVQKTLAQVSGTAGSVRILKTPGTVQNATNLSFSITVVGSAAIASGAAACLGATSAINQTNVVTINGVEVSVVGTDTVDTILSKFNAQNSRTGVIGIKSAANIISLVSGVVDSDAANVVGLGSTAANGSAIGYLTVGTAATITLGGASSVWSALGFTGALTGYFASGTNAAGLMSGIAMVGKGNTLEMQNAGSKAYGIQLGIGMFNGAYGGFLFGRGGTASAINHLSSAGNAANFSFNVANKLDLQVGANYQQKISYSIASIDATSIGSGASTKYASLSQIDISTVENAGLSLKVVQQAIKDVAASRSSMGAVMNRLDYTDKTLQIQRENMTAAQSKIRDADVSLEMSTYTRQQIMLQAGTAMLAQANTKPQSILSLLQ